MRATLLLADAAQAVGGKLYILGGGWSVCGPDPTPMAIAMKLDVPWDQANRRHAWRLELLDADGQPVLVPSEEGEQPVLIEATFEVGRPAGLKAGTSIDLTLAIAIGPLPLPPDSRYEWRLSIDDRSEDDWRLVFTTRPLPEHGAGA